jgi:ribulose-5-phosphate 4-epimerase/fuculose-1-phosphate aldolase
LEAAATTEEVIVTASALSHLGLVDAYYRISFRSGDHVVSTPAPASSPPPSQLASEDFVTLDLAGNVVAGSASVARDIAVDLEIYRRRPDARAIIHAQPRTAMAFVSAGRPLLPLTHTEAILAHPPIEPYGDGALLASSAPAEAFVSAIGDRRVVTLTGLGTISIGGSVADAAMLTMQIDLLAKVNATAAAYQGEVKTVSIEDARRINAQKAGPGDFLTFLRQVAFRRPPSEVPLDDSDTSVDALRRRVVLACRLLYHHALVEHLEHVSVRIPGVSAFLITPRKHLAALSPADLALVGMDGRWLSGPLEPPPFLWFHRDIFAARPDVDAIVHTHQINARAVALSSEAFGPVIRAGARYAKASVVYDVPDLMFDEVHRRRAVQMLGDGNVLHESSHGVDFLATTVEEATVAAILYEGQARTFNEARRLGNPRLLDERAHDSDPAHDPPWQSWWAHYLSELPQEST